MLPKFFKRFPKPSKAQGQTARVGGCGAREGPFRLNLNIQPIKRINGGPPQPPNHDWKPFNLVWTFFEWLEDDILKIWDFGKVPGSHFSKTRKKMCFEIAPLCPVLILQENANKTCVWKNPVLSGSKFPLLAIHKSISHIWEDGSRKVNNDEPELRFFFTETFDLL